MTLRPAFDCRMCGACCQGEGGIVVSEQDQQRMSRCLGLGLEEFLAAHTVPMGGKRVLATGPDGCCVFYRQGTACSVHAFKPDICRAWPYFRGNLVDEISWRLAQDSCPGIDPEAGHGEFVRQGCRYLRENGLIRSGRPDEAAALKAPCPSVDAKDEG